LSRPAAAVAAAADGADLSWPAMAPDDSPDSASVRRSASHVSASAVAADAAAEPGGSGAADAAERSSSASSGAMEDSFTSSLSSTGKPDMIRRGKTRCKDDWR